MRKARRGGTTLLEIGDELVGRDPKALNGSGAKLIVI